MKKALILSGIYWNDPLQRHQQFAVYLQKNGYRVYFIEHIVSAAFSIKKLMSVLGKVSRDSTKSKNRTHSDINVLNMGFVPPGCRIFDFINKRKVNKLVGMVGKEFDLIINYLPISTTRLMIGQITYKKLIYDCVRNFEGWGGYPSDISMEENQLVTRCNKVFTDSYYLTDKMRGKTKKPVVQFLPIASESWRRGCSFEKEIERIQNIAYFGTVDRHIDTTVFKALTEKGYKLHIWGKFSAKMDFPYTYHGYLDDLEKLANAIKQVADAIVLPYQGTMDGVIPAKMMQCLQTRLPVYISRFYDSEQLEKYVYLYNSIEQICEQIAGYNLINHKEKVKRIGDFMKDLDDECQYKRFCQEIQGKE